LENKELKIRAGNTSEGNAKDEWQEGTARRTRS